MSKRISIPQQDITALFEGFEKVKVMVVGDVMVDKYWWGQAERISPEAPVPVVEIKRKENRAGGAANVALNCKALGAEVILATVIGDDEDGALLQKLVAAEGISTAGVLSSATRHTTVKTRVISRNQQMVRIDEEETTELSVADEHRFIDTVLKLVQIEKPQVLIFEDYNKGLLKENVISKIIGHCQLVGVLTAVDPKKKNFLAYKSVDIFKPNLKEIREGLNLAIEEVELPTLQQVHAALQQHLHHQVSLITLSEKGVFYQDGQQAEVFPAHLRNISDVSGAGDTVIAVASLVYALTRNAALMAETANIAGGMACEKAGVVAIDRDDLQREITQLIGDQDATPAS
jgi:rfaE bifunctional protein kinase chain/domain